MRSRLALGLVGTAIMLIWVVGGRAFSRPVEVRPGALDGGVGIMSDTIKAPGHSEGQATGDYNPTTVGGKLLRCALKRMHDPLLVSSTSAETEASTANRERGKSCGNGQCQEQAGEDCATCPQDCGSCPVCGNDVCEAPYENFQNCPQDCERPCTCGDGICGACDFDPETFCPVDLPFCT